MWRGFVLNYLRAGDRICTQSSGFPKPIHLNIYSCLFGIALFHFQSSNEQLIIDFYYSLLEFALSV